MNNVSDVLVNGMRDLTIAGADGAAPAAAAAAAAGAGALAPREVRPYAAPLAAALREMPVVLHRMVESYLKPRDAELLINATFIDFMAASPVRDEAQLMVTLWARSLAVMDYSRVFVVIEGGFLPLCDPTNPGYMAGKIGFRQSAVQNPVTHCIPIDPRILPDLVRTAHARYFPNAMTVVNPGARYSTHDQGGSAALTTTEELQGQRATQPDYPADIDERVAVRNPEKALVDERFSLIHASPSDPIYVVTLNLQPTVRDGQELTLDPSREPFLRAVRHNGIMDFEADTLVDGVVAQLPPEFAPIPLPNLDEEPNADAAPVPVADENGYFG